MSKLSKRWLSLITTLAVAFVMCFGSVGVYATGAAQPEGIGEAQVEEPAAEPAEESAGEENEPAAYEEELTPVTADPDAALTVTDTTVTPAKVKTFSRSQLEKMVTSGHNYSKINNQGTVKVEKGYKGVQVQKILSTAKITPGKSDAIVFSTAPDEGGQTDDISFDWSEFNKTRYYYPNLASADADKGPVKTSTANKGKKTTKSIICLDGDTTLMFGQAYPTERNNPKFWDGVAAGGSITIVPAANEKWEEAPMPTLADGTAIENGATFDLNTELGYTTYSGKGFVYYTIDGSTPSGNSAIYNYAPKKGGTNPIVLSKAGKVRIKAVVKGVGKADSKVTTYTCYVNKGNIADKAKGAYIDGDTQVYNGKKKTPKVVIPGLKSGTDYSVSYESNKLVGEATATVVGKGNYKGSFSLHFEIVPAKAAISSITSKVAGQLVVAIKSQKSSGVDGYVIEFKKSTEDWENCVRVDLEPSSTKEALEGLDSGETYNVRVMAYTSIGSEDKYGQVSTVKTIKVK